MAVGVEALRGQISALHLVSLFPSLRVRTNAHSARRPRRLEAQSGVQLLDHPGQRLVQVFLQDHEPGRSIGEGLSTNATLVLMSPVMFYSTANVQRRYDVIINHSFCIS